MSTRNLIYFLSGSAKYGPFGRAGLKKFELVGISITLGYEHIFRGSREEVSIESTISR